MPVNAALQASETSDLEGLQALEARLKLPGLEALYRLICLRTREFQRTSDLPAAPELGRLIQQNEAGVQKRLRELAGRGENRTPLIGCLPALRYVETQHALERRSVYYGFPAAEMEAGAASLARDYADTNAAALRAWLPFRPQLQGEELGRRLAEQFRKGELVKSTAGWEVRRWLGVEADASPEEARETFRLFGRPVLQKLADARFLFAVEEPLPDGKNLTLLYWNDPAELSARHAALLRVASEVVLERPLAADLAPAALIARVLARADTPAVRALVAEIRALERTLAKTRPARRPAGGDARVKGVLERLVRETRPVPLSALPGADDTLAAELARHPMLLTARLQIREREQLYLLHVDRAGAALENAKKHLKKTGDSAQLELLVRMGAQRVLASAERDELLRLVQNRKGERRGFFSAIREALAGEDSGPAQKKARPAGERKVSPQDARNDVEADATRGRAAADRSPGGEDAPSTIESAPGRERAASEGELILRRNGVSKEEKEMLADRIRAERDRRERERKQMADELARSLRR